MPAPYNPARRNRNIGTPKQGHGQDNRMSVPVSAATVRNGTVRLNLRTQLTRNVGGKHVSFLVEHTTGGCMHACTVEDLCFLLSHVPSSDWAGLATFVLRQSTRKERLLDPAWGRMFYHARLEVQGGVPVSGPVIFLEACDVGTPIKWSTSLDPEDSEELERLRLDGHRVERVGRRHVISATADSVRATQLYRTLPHEIGHWFDWLEKVEGPAARGEDFARLADSYFVRPRNEREAFAHRYADDLLRTLRGKGVIPFPRIEE